MTVVSNTSPIIFLSKIPKLMELAEELYKNILISEEVYKEAVVRGLSSQKLSIKENAGKIQILIDRGFIITKRIKGRYSNIQQSLSERLGTGESSAISLALQENIKTVLIDEKPATTIAREFGLIPKPISLLPIEGYKKGRLSKEEAVRLLDDLLAGRYYLNIADYKKILAMLNK